MVFVYDQHGQLLGEYDSTGKAIREFVWLGSTPVAVFTPDPANAANPPIAYFIHADHLDTPRVVMDKNNAVRWKWLSEPFGVNVPENNPSGLGAFTLNLRFPGQYFDQESGLHYNFFRDYDPGTGRYAQSDPIGLKGGINTYSYVGANPLTFVDPQGLAAAGAVLGGRIGSAAGSRLGPAGAALGQAAGAAVGSWVEDACDCPGGYVHIYRVVGSAEHAEISSLQQYSILANGFGQKQFWLRMSDAAWFVEAEARMQPSVVRTNRYIVSSSICNDNLRRGFPFSDVGHNAISFDAGGLTIVNRDANMTGGIRTLRTIAAQP